MAGMKPFSFARPFHPRRFSCTAAALLTAVSFGRADDEANWPRWRGPDANGISKETGWTTSWPAEGPKQLWKTAVGIGFSSVTVANGRAFTMGNSNETDTVFCFDENSGKDLWKHSYPCPLDAKYYEGGPGSSATCEKDRVYTLSKRGHLFCFDAATGKVIWQKNLIDELGVKKIHVSITHTKSNAAAIVILEQSNGEK